MIPKPATNPEVLPHPDDPIQPDSVLTDPAGLRAFDDINATEQAIAGKTLSAFQSRFPIEDEHHIIEADGWKMDEKRRNPTIARTKAARLAGTSLTVPIRANLRMLDKHTGQVLGERKNFMVGAVPAMTHRGTFVLDGTEYMSFSQLRLLPGIYARLRDNGVPEAQVRTQERTGPGFSVFMEPDSGVFKMELGRGTVRLYDLLNTMGVDDKTLESKWGPELLQANRKGFKGGQSLNRVMLPYIQKWTRPAKEPSSAAHTIDDDDATEETNLTAPKVASDTPMPVDPVSMLGMVAPGKAPKKQQPDDMISGAPPREALEAFFGKMRMDRGVNHRNLGRGWGSINPDTLLETSSKVLKVARGEDPGDDRNALYNKTVHTIDDFLEERVRNDAGGLGRAMLWKAKRGGLEALNPGWFTPQLTGALVRNGTSRGTPVSQPIPGINPVDLLDMRNRVVLTGEGGMPSADAIPMDARDVHHTQVGIIDVIRTPESQGAGIDLRFARGARKGPGNRLYFPVTDRKDNSRKWITPTHAYDKKIMFPRRVDDIAV